MKAVLLNTYDANGGAALATYRLHRGLLDAEVDSSLLVLRRFGSDPSVIGPKGDLAKAWSTASPYLNRLPLRMYPERKRQIFSPAIVPGIQPGKILALSPDLVHLFWVADGFLRPETLTAINKPLIWTLHDMWPFTGGCHYDGECRRYRESCGNCPVLGAHKEKDLSRNLWRRKSEAWRDLDLTVVATSNWIADCARESSLFRESRIEVIPNGFDVSKYKPLDKSNARSAFNLPQDKKLVLFSSFSATADRRKGFQYLVPALQGLTEQQKSQIELVVLGATSPNEPLEFGMPVHFIDHLHDEISQVMLYSAVDVVVLPSVQENLSNTVIEAMLCGAPVVAFEIGGMPDMIDHQATGYLAKPFDPVDLAAGIWAMVADTDVHLKLSSAARKRATKCFSVRDVAERYRDLYRDVCS